MKKIILIAASVALLAGPAFAQDSKTIGTAPADAKFSTVSKDEMFSSKLKGLNVYNQKDESIGEITELSINNHPVGRRLPRRRRTLRGRVAFFGQRSLRHQERQVAGVDEHHQGSAEGSAR